MQNAPAMLAQKMMNRQAAYAPVGMVSQNMSGNKKGAGGGGGGALGLAFDPTTASAGVTFTNNNITAQNTSGATIRSAKSANGSTVGLVAGWYCEFTVGSAGQMFMGIGPSSFVCNTANRVGIGVGNGVSYRPDTGEIYRGGGTQITGLVTALTGDVIGIKLDLTATTSFITVLKNGVVILSATDTTTYIPNNASSWIPVWSSGVNGVIASISNNIYSAPGYIPFTTNGTSALISTSASVPAVADGAYDVYTFNASGTFTALSTGSVRALVIAGGGGAQSAGGAGAGGYQEKGVITTPQTYTITVGAGGGNFSNGNNSSIGTALVSTGGGTGGVSPGSGGSGGGAWEDGATSAPAGSGIAGQGFAGGNAQYSGTSGDWSHGSGGGAGSVGGASTQFYGGTGGAGLTSSITGVAVARGGGGAGRALTGGTLYEGTATAGGGNGNSQPGAANTGGGSGPNATGGSGIVIIRVRARA